MKQSSKKIDAATLSWFQANGLRFSTTRKILFETLNDAGSPLSVPELQKAFAKKRYFPNKTTLYREIERLVSADILSKVQLSEARVSYELADDHHHHFVCQRCARVTKLAFCENLMKTLGTALRKQGKKITHHNFEFFGVCEFCL